MSPEGIDRLPNDGEVREQIGAAMMAALNGLQIRIEEVTPTPIWKPLNCRLGDPCPTCGQATVSTTEYDTGIGAPTVLLAVCRANCGYRMQLSADR